MESDPLLRFNIAMLIFLSPSKESSKDLTHLLMLSNVQVTGKFQRVRIDRLVRQLILHQIFYLSIFGHHDIIRFP
jgi:hypothetical protein